MKETSCLEAPEHQFLTATELRKTCACTADDFLSVMQNLIVNPNILSSHLFRADILWDSERDTTFNVAALLDDTDLSAFTKHMKQDYRPRKIKLKEWHLQRSIVRMLVPRNPQLDRPLVQTCHFFSCDTTARDYTHSGDQLVIYLPHADTEAGVPWYHPPLRAIAFLYTDAASPSPDGASGGEQSLTMHYSLFADTTEDLPERTRKTLLNLLETVHKHSSNGQSYVKRVHHDQVIPQKRFQDTYTAFKSKYAKQLISNWREQTNVSKGVFEDLAIAAFLVELWRDMYSEKAFPGFVDLACGNGCLVYILRQEGYSGSGFDARSRKTWEEFPADVRTDLHEMVLIPSILDCDSRVSSSLNDSERSQCRAIPKTHDGYFPLGTFLISNHADELTPWTPILAYLNQCPFIAIPCCSHALDGSKYRYPTRSFGTDETKANDAKATSAYATLCGYVANLTSTLGYNAEKEILRIPSTRNTCIIGRHRAEDADGAQHTEQAQPSLDRDMQRLSIEASGNEDKAREAREGFVRALIAQEAQMPLELVAKGFRERAMGVYQSKGRNH